SRGAARWSSNHADEDQAAATCCACEPDRRGRGRRACPYQRSAVHDGFDAAPQIAGRAGFADLARDDQPHAAVSCGVARGPARRSGRGDGGQAEQRKSKGDRALRRHRGNWHRAADEENRSPDASDSFQLAFRSQGFSRMKPELKIWHPFTQEALDPPPIRITKAEGVYLYTDDGRRLIDGISSWWVNLHGHGHPAIMAAIAEQTRKLDHVLLAGFSHEPLENLRDALRKVLPENLAQIFFSDDGSTAVEVALKMAVQYWKNVGRPEK